MFQASGNERCPTSCKLARALERLALPSKEPMRAGVGYSYRCLRYRRRSLLH